MSTPAASRSSPWPTPTTPTPRPGPLSAARWPRAGFAGVIIPDIPAGEAADYLATATAAGLDATLMVAPATPRQQLEAIAARTRGFLYVMGVMNTTGTTSHNSDPQRWALADRARPLSARPALIGFGIDTPDRAAAAVRHADGVIVASALMRRVLAGDTPRRSARPSPTSAPP